MTDQKPIHYLAHPESGSRLWHIFQYADDRSLCGRYMMWRVDHQRTEDVDESTQWVKGQDCKACFRKAGLLDG
jgi:hypothetical protein